MSIENNENIVPFTSLPDEAGYAPEETPSDFDGDWDEDGIYIDNNAVFTVDYEAEQLIIYFGGDRNVVMELDGDVEVMLVDKVLQDPNFWLEFLNSFSAAIKKSIKGD